jgi:uncharacterized membrane protein SirB2
MTTAQLRWAYNTLLIASMVCAAGILVAIAQPGHASWSRVPVSGLPIILLLAAEIVRRKLHPQMPRAKVFPLKGLVLATVVALAALTLGSALYRL